MCAALRQLGLPFDSITPQEIRAHCGIILTTSSEAPHPAARTILYEDIDGRPPAILRAMIAKYARPDLAGSDLVIGVDPGVRTGLAATYCGAEIESSVHLDAEQLVSHMIAILAGLPARKKLVRIGRADMRLAKSIGAMLNLRFCSSFELEFVDEQRTSLRTKSYNQRGRRDRQSARFISQRRGPRRLVEPLSITG